MRHYEPQERLTIAREVFERIRAGEKVSVACDREGISWSTLWAWKDEDPQLQREYKAAQSAAALLHAEKAEQAAETAKPETVQVARLQVDTHKWIASVKDRDTYGDKLQKDVTVNIAQLHLEALKAPRATAKLLTDATDAE